MVFAGFGITAPEYNYDDYAGLDVKGKIVLLLRHEPQEFDEKSVFEGKVYTAHSQIFSKAANAKIHGAKAVLMVNDVGSAFGRWRRPGEIRSHRRPRQRGHRVRSSEGQRREPMAGAQRQEPGSHRERHRQGPASGIVRSAEKLRLDMDVDIAREVKTVHNVGAYLPGETSEYVVIGAHYDHLGLGEQFSLAPSLTGTVHPGADDNASGTAGVIELARWFSRQPKHQRGILFLTFAGEELGLLGSSYYVNHPLLPLKDDVAMINMDMIGRIRDRKIYLGGVGTGTTFAALLKQLAPKHDFDADLSEKAGYGSSDHTSFTTKQVPVLFFFSGLHADYHKPSDTWDKIDAPDAVRLLDLVADVTDHLIDQLAATAICPSGRDAAAGRSGQSALGQGVRRRLRPRLRQYSRFHRTPQWGKVRRRKARFAGRQGGSQGRRHSDRVRRQTDPKPVRFHVRATGQSSWPGSTCQGAPGEPNN